MRVLLVGIIIRESMVEELKPIVSHFACRVDPEPALTAEIQKLDVLTILKI